MRHMGLDPTFTQTKATMREFSYKEFHMDLGGL
jgi:hypothetical protein